MQHPGQFSKIRSHILTDNKQLNLSYFNFLLLGKLSPLDYGINDIILSLKI